MRNLSATGAIHSPIDADRDVSAYSTDFAALGLPDHSPFDILSRMSAPIKKAPSKPKKKSKTKLQQTIAALENPKPRAGQIHIVSRAERNRRARFNIDIPSRTEATQSGEQEA